jgi:exopolyphosphatase/guanosine-5'-triphosphate,3'-diphosphate pyrophosphatase
MDRTAMIAGVVDIGSNSMRLLLVDSDGERLREVEVTALGSGVDRTGRFNEERVAATLEVLGRYGEIMDRVGVGQRRAVATSATRDAEDGAEFIERAARVLGVVPEVISGTEEAELSYLGATASFDDQLPTVVIDIGGGSTEFVYGAGSVKTSTCIDIGSVRLTERSLPSRPAPAAELSEARAVVAREFQVLSPSEAVDRAIGVAGSFTSLAAITLDLPEYDRDRVHGSVLTTASIHDLIERFSEMTIAETAAIPSLDPKRAQVLLAGAVIAEGALQAVGVDEIAVSEHDLLDGMALEAVRSP